LGGVGRKGQEYQVPIPCPNRQLRTEKGSKDGLVKGSSFARTGSGTGSDERLGRDLKSMSPPEMTPASHLSGGTSERRKVTLTQAGADRGVREPT